MSKKGISNSSDKLTKGEKTRLLILSKSIELFGTHGYFNTSMQMIASECDLSQGAVMQHFPSKNKLLETVRKFVSNSNHDFVDSQISISDDGYTSLIKHIKNNFQWALKFKSEASIIIIIYEHAFFDSEFKEIANAAFRLGTERILRYILAAQRENSIQIEKNVSSEQIALIIHEFLVGLIIKNVPQTDKKKIWPEIEERITFTLSKLLNYSN